jgi:hypothetical protein
VFAAHSECDETADIQGIKKLRKKTLPDRFHSFFISKDAGVSHASLVLETPINAPDSAEGEAPLEEANSQFAAMMTAITDFEKKHDIL